MNQQEEYPTQLLVFYRSDTGLREDANSLLDLAGEQLHSCF
jgi:hypothetical protein